MDYREKGSEVEAGQTAPPSWGRLGLAWLLCCLWLLLFGLELQRGRSASLLEGYMRFAVDFKCVILRLCLLFLENGKAILIEFWFLLLSRSNLFDDLDYLNFSFYFRLSPVEVYFPMTFPEHVVLSPQTPTLPSDHPPHPFLFSPDQHPTKVLPCLFGLLLKLNFIFVVADPRRLKQHCLYQQYDAELEHGVVGDEQLNQAVVVGAFPHVLEQHFLDEGVMVVVPVLRGDGFQLAEVHRHYLLLQLAQQRLSVIWMRPVICLQNLPPQQQKDTDLLFEPGPDLPLPLEALPLAGLGLEQQAGVGLLVAEVAEVEWSGGVDFFLAVEGDQADLLLAPGGEGKTQVVVAFHDINNRSTQYFYHSPFTVSGSKKERSSCASQIEGEQHQVATRFKLIFNRSRDESKSRLQYVDCCVSSKFLMCSSSSHRSISQCAIALSTLLLKPRHSSHFGVRVYSSHICLIFCKLLLTSLPFSKSAFVVLIAPH